MGLEKSFVRLRDSECRIQELKHDKDTLDDFTTMVNEAETKVEKF